MRGLQDGSKLKEEIVKIDDKKAIRYRIVEEVIDLDALKKEKEALEAQLAEKEPSEEELVEVGRSVHSWYLRDIYFINKRLEEIDGLLSE